MTTEAITPLRQRMIEDMNSRKLCALAHKEATSSAASGSRRFSSDPPIPRPLRISAGSSCMAETDVSICNRNRIMTGLRFLFRVTLRRLDLAEEV